MGQRTDSPMSDDASKTSLQSPRASSPTLLQKKASSDNEASSSDNNKSLQKTVLGLLKNTLLTAVLLVLATAWLGLLGTYTARHLYDEYIYPMVRATERTEDHETIWRSDATYYYRRCTAQDLTAWVEEADELVLQAAPPGTDGKSDAGIITPAVQKTNVDKMMTHGVGIIPELLSVSTVAKLRQYIVYRNENLSSYDEININPNYGRQAFALDPGEHISVQNALNELASNAVLKSTLQGLLGDDDPALTEMSSLTSYVGAEAQGWHHDVIVETGTAVQYARTYSYSYSLFIPLQDTWAEMGATNVCPGSHMCGESANTICDRYGFQPLLYRNTNGQRVWRAGDGVLFNQQLCHRGEEHTAGRERIMFVVSFTRRPQLGVDSRVLSKGLFCFVLWRIWGLTWQDLYASSQRHTTSLVQRTLRSLGVWKPANSNWGLDFVTKSVMEWNIGENGMEKWSVPDYAKDIQATLGFPNFLQGRVIIVDDEEEAPKEDVYDTYIRSTLDKFWSFLLKVNAGLVILVLIFYSIASCVGSSKRPAFRRVLWGAFVMYALPSMLLFWHLQNVKESEWGRNIQSGLTFREPFPPVRKLMEKDDESGPTTFPERVDVLIDTRFDSPYLGSYARWIDYHPGNAVYRRAVREASEYFGSYHELPPAFQGTLEKDVLNSMSGRMLKQDWQTGDWMVMSEATRDRRIRHDIAAESNKVLGALDMTINVLLARNRFDVPHRESALALAAQSFLLRLRTKLFAQIMGVAGRRKNDVAPVDDEERDAVKGLQTFRSIAFALPQPVTAMPKTRNARWTALPKDDSYRIGDVVYLEDDDGSLDKAAIWDIWNDDSGELRYNLGFENGPDALGRYGDELLPLFSMEEGSRVYCRRGEKTYARAVVTRINPYGLWNIRFEPDGERYDDVDPNEFCMMSTTW